MEEFKKIVYTVTGILVIIALLLGPDRVERILNLENSPTPLFGPGSINDPVSTNNNPARRPDAPTFKPVAPEDFQDRVKNSELEKAQKDLIDLTIVKIGSMNGYDRDKFSHWNDPDDNGCDARADILRRDALEITKTTKDGCKPLYGEWKDPYAGKTMRTSRVVDIDHLIPLAQAWREGASGWDDKKREAFANDPDNLLAVDASQNRTKGDKPADAWRPPRQAFWCRYAVLIINVHAKYDLGVSQAEKAALSQMLQTCPA